MVDVTFHDHAVNYPSVSARANMPLRMQFKDQLVVQVPVVRALIAARRSSTSDPWEIELTYIHGTRNIVLGSNTFDFDANDLNWKSMADLTVKQHFRADNPTEWELVAQTNLFIVTDATKPCGKRFATLAEEKALLKLKLDDAGNARLQYTPGTGDFANYGRGVGMVGTLITYVLSQTTETSVASDTLWFVEDLYPADKDLDGYIEVIMPMAAIQGTEDISIANLTGTKLRIKTDAAAAGGYDDMTSVVDVGTSGVYVMPSIHLDHLRKAQNAGVLSRISLRLLKDRGLYVSINYDAASSGVAGTIMNVSLLDPDGVVSTEFDQANSMNVLAAAAFAGLAGLASVGIATELRNLLENSALSPLFSQVAVALGQTTAGVISGYVSALVAAYANGWIDNETLFDLDAHVSWLRSGTTILLAGSGAAAAGSILTALTRLGVDNSLVSSALATASGAIAGGGIALGMASVMAKVVKHRYLGA